LEFESPPLRNNMTNKEKARLYNEIHKSNKTYANSTAKWPKFNNGALFSVRGNIDTKYVVRFENLLFYVINDEPSLVI
jgi:hypothetical protein